MIDVPDTAGRYYVIQLLDAYSNTFAYIGRRTTGTQAGSYAIVPPGFTGAAARRVRRIESPTNLIWVLGRTLVRSAADLPAVTQLMGGYRVTAALLLGRRRAAGAARAARLPAEPAARDPVGPRPSTTRSAPRSPRTRRRRATRCALRAFAAAASAPGGRPATRPRRRPRGARGGAAGRRAPS